MSAHAHKRLEAWNHLRYHEDLRKIIGIVASSRLEEALEVEIFNNMGTLVPPRAKEVKGRWRLPQVTRHGPRVKVIPSTKESVWPSRSVARGGTQLMKYTRERLTVSVFAHYAPHPQEGICHDDGSPDRFGKYPPLRPSVRQGTG